MSKIPYTFCPIPPEFLDDEFLQDFIMMKIIRHIFKEISTIPQIKRINNNRRYKDINLQPFEFIFGRQYWAKELQVSEKQIRTRIDRLKEKGFIKQPDNFLPETKGQRASSSEAKSASSSASTYSILALATESFHKNKGQQLFDEKTNSVLSQNPELSPKGQQLGQQFGPHVIEYKNEKNERLSLDKKRTLGKSYEQSNVTSDNRCYGRSLSRSPLSNEKKEDLTVLQLFINQHELGITDEDLTNWLRKHEGIYILDHLRLLLDAILKGKDIPNRGGWMQKALSTNYIKLSENEKENLEFATKLKAEWNLKSLKIMKKYCVEEFTQNDYSFSLDPELFKDMLLRKFKIEEASQDVIST